MPEGVDVLFTGDPAGDPETEMAKEAAANEPSAPEPETPAPTPTPAKKPASGLSYGSRGGTQAVNVPSVGADVLKFIFMIFVLVILYDVVTHGSAWSGVFSNISSHLTNFISVKPLGTVSTTSSAWSNVL